MALSPERKIQKYIKRRLSYWVIVLAVVIIMGSIYNVWQLSGVIEHQSLERQVEVAENVEFEMTQWLQYDMKMIETIKNLLSHLDYKEINQQKRLNKYFQMDVNNNGGDAFYLGLSDGVFLTGKDWTPPASYDPRVRPWYLEALRNGKTTVGNTYLDSDTLKTIFTISSPITTKDGMTGVLGVDIYLDTVERRLKDIISGTAFEVVLIDGNGIIVYYTADPYLSGRSINEINKSKIGQFYKTYQDRDTESKRLLTINPDELILINQVENSEWVACIFSSDKKVVGIADRGIRQHYLINGILVILALLALYIFYNMEKRLKQNQLEMQKHIEELDTAQKTIELINKQLVLKSNTDGLTRVFNRGYLDEQLERYWSAGIADGKALGLILVDVDHFKKYNDTYGHISGDQVLIQICREMSRCLDPKYVLARYGGEEFAVLAYAVTEDELMTIADKMNKKVESSNIPHEASDFGHVTISIGLNVFVPTEHETIGNFIHKADLALYEAKMTGRNKVVLYSGRR